MPGTSASYSAERSVTGQMGLFSFFARPTGACDTSSSRSDAEIVCRDPSSSWYSSSTQRSTGSCGGDMDRQGGGRVSELQNIYIYIYIYMQERREKYSKAVAHLLEDVNLSWPRASLRCCPHVLF